MAGTGTIKPILIGELLFTAGVLRREDLSRALQISSEHGLPIGRVLIILQYLSEEELKAALQAQSLINDGILAVAMGVKAIDLVKCNKVKLDQALEHLGWVRSEVLEGNKLGELLLGSGMLTAEQLSEALAMSAETRLPIGRILLLTGVLPDELLTSVLNAQMMIRHGKLTRQEALGGLVAARQRCRASKQDLIHHRAGRLPRYQAIKLGQLFVLSGLLTEADLMNSLQKSLGDKLALGEVFVESGFASRATLDSALRLQEMVINGTLNALEAAEALWRIHTSAVELSEAVAFIAMNEADRDEFLRIDQLLILVGLVTLEQLVTVVDAASAGSVSFADDLLLKGIIDRETLRAALRCQSLLRRGFLEIEEAIIGLNFCKRNKVGFDDALERLKWTVPLGCRESGT